MVANLQPIHSTTAPPIRSTAQFISHWSVTVTAQQVDYRLHLIGGGQLHCIGGVVVTHRPIHRVN